MGWQQKHLGSQLESSVLSRCDVSVLFYAIRLCQVCILNGHEDVVVDVG